MLFKIFFSMAFLLCIKGHADSGSIQKFIDILDGFLEENGTTSYWITVGVCDGDHNCIALRPKTDTLARENSSVTPPSAAATQKTLLFSKRHPCVKLISESFFTKNPTELKDIWRLTVHSEELSPYFVAIVYCPSHATLAIKKVNDSFERIPILSSKALKSIHSTVIPMVYSFTHEPPSLSNFRFSQEPPCAYATVNKVHFISLMLTNHANEDDVIFLYSNFSDVPTIFSKERSYLIYHGINVPKSFIGALALSEDGIQGFFSAQLPALEWSSISEEQVSSLADRGWDLTYRNGRALFTCPNLVKITQIREI